MNRDDGRHRPHADNSSGPEDGWDPGKLKLPPAPSLREVVKGFEKLPGFPTLVALSCGAVLNSALFIWVTSSGSSGGGASSGQNPNGEGPGVAGGYGNGQGTSPSGIDLKKRLASAEQFTNDVHQRQSVATDPSAMLAGHLSSMWKVMWRSARAELPALKVPTRISLESDEGVFEALSATANAISSLSTPVDELPAPEAVLELRDRWKADKKSALASFELAYRKSLPVAGSAREVELNIIPPTEPLREKLVFVRAYLLQVGLNPPQGNLDSQSEALLTITDTLVCARKTGRETAADEQLESALEKLAASWIDDSHAAMLGFERAVPTPEALAKSAVQHREMSDNRGEFAAALRDFLRNHGFPLAVTPRGKRWTREDLQLALETAERTLKPVGAAASAYETLLDARRAWSAGQPQAALRLLGAGK